MNISFNMTVSIYIKIAFLMCFANIYNSLEALFYTKKPPKQKLKYTLEGFPRPPRVSLLTCVFDKEGERRRERGANPECISVCCLRISGLHLISLWPQSPSPS